MKIFRFFILLAASTLLSAGPLNASEFKKGTIYEGFRLIEKKFVKEVNSECLSFVHEKSGARLFKISSEDNNKTFAISFKTDPESNSGTPHIMEHSVLNGSKSFPVKSPYDILRKGSLLTYINAYTGDDMTLFPIASKNEKDYFNLMHVYLDAVFQPKLMTDSRVLKQEGWHYEMEDPGRPAVYKGVVYNEMKGAYSDPYRELSYQINRILFPDNGYRFTSGGYPADIPSLTYEAFKKYHDKYYHPSNSYIFLYGDCDLMQELKFINDKYLSGYDKQTPPEVFPLQKPFTSMKTASFPYGITAGSDTAGQTYIAFSVVTGLNTDRSLVMGLNTICDVLVNQESAPIRLALQKAGIGKDVGAYVDEKRQNLLQITVQNASNSDKEKFLEIVLNGFREAAEKGLDKKAVEGSINRAEFALREGNNSQKGLNYAFQILPGWFFGDDPYLTLEYDGPLAVLKTALTGNYLERIIRENILENPHSLLLSLEPKAGYDNELRKKTEKELEEFSSSLSASEKEQLIKETKELIEFQKKPDSPEDLATVPLLEKKDINPKADWYPLKERKLKGTTVLNYEAFSNNVVYAKFYFDLRVLPQELLPYASLLAEVLGSQNTEHFTFGELDNELNIHTGGFGAAINCYTENQSDEKLIPKFIITSKAMAGKTSEMIKLLEEIIKRTKLEDSGRLKVILNRYKARLEEQVKGNGLYYAQNRALSYFSKAGLFSELISGIDYFRFINGLALDYDNKSAVIIDNLKKTASLLFNRNNLMISLTGGSKDLSNTDSRLSEFIVSLPEGKSAFKKWNLNPEKKNEGFQTSSKVQYVIKGYNFKKLGYEWTGCMKVLNQIVSRDYLHNRIRVIGGAYGGFSSIDETGNLLFMSYRDPNLKETLTNYNSVPEYLEKLTLNEKDLTRYIIGTIATMDSPQSVNQKGSTAVTHYFSKTGREDLQKTRDAVINTTLADIKSFREMLMKVIEQDAFCVYGNEDKINSGKDLFMKTEKIIQQ